MNEQIPPTGRLLSFDARFTLVRVTAERQPAFRRLVIAPTTERAVHATGTKFTADPITGLALIQVELESLGLRYLRIRLRALQEPDRRLEQDFDLTAGEVVPAAQRASAYAIAAGISGSQRRTVSLATVWPGASDMEVWLIPLDSPANATGIHAGDPAHRYALHALRLNDSGPQKE